MCIFRQSVSVSSLILGLVLASAASAAEKGALQSPRKVDPAAKAIDRMEKKVLSLDKGRKPLSDRLAAYRNETDEIKRYDLCQSIILSGTLNKLRSKGAQETSSKKDMETYENAKAYCKWAIDRVKAFEASLTLKDWEKIAAKVPGSFLPSTQRLVGNSFRGQCLEKDFVKWANSESQDIENPNAYGYAMAYAVYSEELNWHDYYPPYMKLLKEKKPEYDGVVKHIVNKLDMQKRFTPKGIEERLRRSEKNLRESGVEDPKSFVANGIRMAPSCVGVLNGEVVDLAKAHFTRLRLRKIYAALRDYESKSGKPLQLGSRQMEEMSDLSDPDLKKHMESLGLNPKDAWKAAIHVSMAGGRLAVMSYGDDKKAETDDDIVYKGE